MSQKFYINVFSVVIFLFLSATITAITARSCISLQRNRALRGVLPERVVHSESLDQCIEACLYVSEYCSRMLFTSLTGSCQLFPQQIPHIFANGHSEQLHRKHGTVYVSLDIHCFYRQFFNLDGKRRSAGVLIRMKKRAANRYKMWTEWSPCSASCGSGKEQRVRDCQHGYNCAEDLLQYRNCNKGPCSQWGQWTDWNSCSVTCGTGMRKRSRFCNTYYGCPGDREEVEECELRPCSQWNQWGPWGACSKICGGGSRTRTRTCTIYGGCQGESSETKKCNKHSCCAKWSGWSKCSISCGPRGAGVEIKTRRCTVEGTGPYGYASKLENRTRPCGDYLVPCGEWHPWEPWALCTVTCGGGERSRMRTCTVHGACQGKRKQYKRCHDEECPGLQPWGPWTMCTATCNGGTKNRQRVCDVAGECDGDITKEQRRCHEEACPEWTEWGRWSRCTEECGGGWQRRARVCDHVNLCPGDKKEKRICNEHHCPEWTAWNGWADCSKPCAAGVKLRTRACNMDEQFCQGENINHPSCFCEGKSENGMACNTHNCAHWGPWTDWGTCNNECGGGEHLRTRHCKSDQNFCVGDNKNHPSCICMEGTNSETKQCNLHPCPEWSSWAEWGECSEPCGGGAKERRRTCIVDEPFCAIPENNNAFSCVCPGLDYSNDQCNTHECPYWSRWSSWGECTVPCGKGIQIRNRICEVDTTVCTETSTGASCECQGYGEEEQQCNENRCAEWTEWGQWADCSVTCGDGSIVRDRKCKNDPSFCYGDALQQPSCQCEGSANEADDCNPGECFTWSSWETWGACSQVCGGGSRNRARQCPVVDGCPGLGQETEFCNQLPCPDWGSWGAWSSCSVSCGGGQHVRNRACPLPNGCSPGKPFEAEECNGDKCPEWTSWMEWSECSRTCGEGERRRTRQCKKDGQSTTADCLGRQEDLESCFDIPCALSTFWSEWSPCTQTCDGGLKTRQRAKCIEPGCETETEQQPCQKGPCPQWSSWDDWSICSKTCGSGSRIRQRQCVDADGNEIARGCVGKTKETDPNACNAIAC